MLEMILLKHTLVHMVKKRENKMCDTRILESPREDLLRMADWSPFGVIDFGLGAPFFLPWWLLLYGVHLILKVSVNNLTTRPHSSVKWSIH